MQISNDFELLHPNVANSFTEKWNALEPELIEILKSNVQNSFVKQKLLEVEKLDDDSKMAVILLGLRAALYGSTATKSNEQNSKASIMSSLKSMLILSASEMAMITDIAIWKENIRGKGTTLQPVMMSTGNAIDSIQGNSTIYFEGIFYKFSSLQLALEMLIKIYEVFNLAFPKSNKNVYQFLTKKFYNIQNKSDGKFSSKTNILLNAFNDEEKE